MTQNAPQENVSSQPKPHAKTTLPPPMQKKTRNCDDASHQGFLESQLGSFDLIWLHGKNRLVVGSQPHLKNMLVNYHLVGSELWCLLISRTLVHFGSPLQFSAGFSAHQNEMFLFPGPSLKRLVLFGTFLSRCRRDDAGFQTREFVREVLNYEYQPQEALAGCFRAKVSRGSFERSPLNSFNSYISVTDR